MGNLHDARLKLRGELEAPPALRKFGSGWISGVLGLVLGVGGFFIVLSLRAPGLFSMPEVRALHDHGWFHLVVFALLIGAFAFSALSLALRPGKILGTCGMVPTLLAGILGGATATPDIGDPTPVYFGLDWFVLNVIFTGFLFVPVERIFPHRGEQHVFRDEWREDLFYFLVSSMMVQLLTFLTFVPAHAVQWLAPLTGTRAWIAALPFVIQLLAIMFLTDFVQYWVHRAFHRIPWLWKFHSVHHSAKHMDWMAGARMHFFEIIVLRSTTVIPMVVLGFAPAAVYSYILLVYLYSTFVHANVGWRFPIIERIFVTPRFHHWHHGIEKEAIDVNFSIHFPIFDRVFGTHHLPKDQWPSGYGIGGHPVPSGYLAQFKYPFQRGKKKPPADVSPSS